MPGLDHLFLSTRVSFVFLNFLISNDEYSSVKFMELISFKTTNSLQSVSTVAWRPICHPVSSQIHSYKQEMKHSLSHNYFIKIASFRPSIANKPQRRELCAAKILSLMPHTTFQHSQRGTEVLLRSFDWTWECLWYFNGREGECWKVILSGSKWGRFPGNTLIPSSQCEKDSRVHSI